MRKIRVIALAVGWLMLLSGSAAFIGAGVLAAAYGSGIGRDDAGFVNADAGHLSSETGVVTTSDLEEVGVSAPDWMHQALATDLRIVVEPGSNQELFLGIAQTADVERYLAGAARHQVMSVSGGDADLRRVEGTATLEPPRNQSFWAASATGSEQPAVSWNASGGEWTAVLMNADGRGQVAADVTAGAKYGSVWLFALLLAMCGVLLMVGALPVMFFGVNEELGESPSVGSMDKTPAPVGTAPKRAVRRVLTRRR